MSEFAAAMLTRCLACERAFPANDELQWLSVGRRVAFDAARGRLWIICVAELEARWRTEERMAAIIDRELTPPPAGAEFVVQFPVERAPPAP